MEEKFKPLIINITPYQEKKHKTIIKLDEKKYVVKISVNSNVSGGGASTAVMHPSSVNGFNVGQEEEVAISIKSQSEQVTTNKKNNSNTMSAIVRPYFYYPPENSDVLSSPSHSDSGAGSDFDAGSTPPSLNQKHVVLLDEDEDSISCDSLNSSELNAPPVVLESSKIIEKLQELKIPKIVECTSYSERNNNNTERIEQLDHYYNFHLNEKSETDNNEELDTFAGVKSVLCGTGERGAIKSAKGTIRGVKNRVRAGIATFLQIEDSLNFKDREQGKLVVYTTTMGVVRATYLRCVKVKQILRTLLVKFDERDVFMSKENQLQLKNRMKTNVVNVPQVFLDGLPLGDADSIERMNESGDLRRLLRPFKCPDAGITCGTCGGYRLLPCTTCNGSKKSVHRNHFTAEFVALKCMACDESGLVKCHSCT